MEERPARAMLVPTADLGDGLTTVISRSEVEAALASEGEPIELVLDVTRFSDGEAGESRSVPMSWERFDLERLLEQATSENIALTFDRDAVWQAIATDVEAHGMREAVVTLAVAATVATGAAGQASAYPSPAFGDSSSAATAPVTGDLAPDDRAVPRPTPVAASAPDLAPDDRAIPRPMPIVASTPDLAPDSGLSAGQRDGVGRDVVGAHPDRDGGARRCNRPGDLRCVLPRRRSAGPPAPGVAHC